jgi:hypothetical protein
VLAGRPRHIADRPPTVASTNSRTLVPFHCLLEGVTAKKTHGRLQSGAGQPESLLGRLATRPTRLWPLHMASLCQVYSWAHTSVAFYERQQCTSVVGAKKGKLAAPAVTRPLSCERIFDIDLRQYLLTIPLLANKNPTTGY